MHRARHSPAVQSLLIALLCLAAAAAYHPGLSGDYMFDDIPNLLNNPWMKVDSLDADELYSAALSSGAGLFRRPVSMATFAMNRALFGIDPWSFKATNLAVHLLTGIGLFLLVRLLVGSYRTLYRPDLPERTAFWLPVIVAGLWLVHPLNLTPVLYIVQRMTSMAALFTIFGLCLYTLGRQRMLAGRHGITHILAGLLLFGSLAVLSKETGVLMPLYMLVIELALFRFRGREGTRSRFVIGLFAVTILLPLGLFLAIMLTRPEALLNYHSRNFTLAERVLTETRVLVFYLKLIVMPSIDELGLYHDDIPLSHGLLDPPATLYSILALLALLGAGLAMLRTRPLAGLGILWFFAGHALESTIFQLDIAYEHRNYLADAGILLALCSLGSELRLSRTGQVARTVLPAFFLLVFTYSTWLRASQWGDTVDYALYEAQHHPDSFLSVYAAARIYAKLALTRQPGTLEKAYDYLDRAAALDETTILTEATRIKISYVLDQPVDPAWFDDIVERLQRGPIRPTHIDSLHDLSGCVAAQCDLPAATMDRLFRAALANPSLAHLPVIHAELLNIYGYFSINKTGNFDRGYELFSRALELQPTEPQRWVNLTRLLIAMYRYDEAEELLARFRESGAHGSVASVASELQSEIDSLREEAGSMQAPVLSRKTEQ